MDVGAMLKLREEQAGMVFSLVPDLDMVIVTTASPDVSEARRGHRQDVFDILLRDVVQPLLATR